jgi:hypothetical protein
MLDENSPNLHLEEIKLRIHTIETDQDHPHIPETGITQLQTEDLTQEIGITLAQIADHTHQIETENDLGIIHLQEGIIPEIEVDHPPEADMKTTTNSHHLHQDPHQEAIQQEEEQNSYPTQVQKQSSSRSTVKNTFPSVRKTNNGLSLIFVEYPSNK